MFAEALCSVEGAERDGAGVLVQQCAADDGAGLVVEAESEGGEPCGRCPLSGRARGSDPIYGLAAKRPGLFYDLVASRLRSVNIPGLAGRRRDRVYSTISSLCDFAP